MGISNRVSSRRLVPLALLAMGALTACGPHLALSLNMRAVQLTVPRVIPPAITLPAPVPIVVTVPAPPIPNPPAPPAVAQILPAPSPSPSPSPPKPPVNACPNASEFAVPAEPASLVVPKGPAPATYLERSQGSYTGSGATPASGRLTNDVFAVVTDLPNTSSTVGQVGVNWLVTQLDTKTHAASIQGFQVVETSGSAAAQATGLYLTGWKWQDPVRGNLSFVPSGGGVELMPLPANPTQVAPVQWSSVATDPNSLTTMSVAGNVLGRSRIDVCGTVVDTWTVVLTGTITSQSVQWQYTWRLQVATQYGALPIQEALSLSTPGGPFSWNRTLRYTKAPGGTA